MAEFTPLFFPFPPTPSLHVLSQKMAPLLLKDRVTTLGFCWASLSITHIYSLPIPTPQLSLKSAHFSQVICGWTFDGPGGSLNNTHPHRYSHLNPQNL